MTNTDLIAEVRDFAADNYYSDSWDLVCSWPDAKLLETIGTARTRRRAIANTWQFVKVINASRSPGSRPVRPVSLFTFLAKAGGLKPHPELAAVLDTNPFVGGVGPLLRRTGLDLDSAREAAVEAGYIYETPWEGGPTVSTINELLEALGREARGHKVYTLFGAGDCEAPSYDPNLEDGYALEETF